MHAQFLHSLVMIVRIGLVEITCLLCGRKAWVSSERVLKIWEQAHLQHCRKPMQRQELQAKREEA